MSDRSTLPDIETRGLTVRYGSKVALRGVDFDAPAGEITAVIGPSGCGKSTLLSVFNRLTDLSSGCAVDGEVRLGTADIRDPSLDVRALRRRVGMVFQRPNPFPLSVRENLALPLREHGVERGAVEARIESALRDVGLWDEVHGHMDGDATRLSGGQQQRLCIARALVLDPAVLLFDEPCSALDPNASRVVEQQVASLRGRVTVVIVTHNLAQARRIADRTAVLWTTDGAGTLLESGPTADVFDAPVDPTVADYVRGVRG